MKRLFALLFLAVAVLPAYAAKENYRITLTIEGSTDSMLLMGNYYGKGTYAIDTAFLDKKGRYIFSSTTKELLPGLYFFANKSGKYVEFVVYNEKPFFEFSTRNDDWHRYMKVKGSAENDAFYGFHHLQQQAMLMSVPPANPDSATYTAFMRRQGMMMDSLRRDFIARNPDRMISRMMMATKEPEVPATDSAGNPLDNRGRWEYFVAHYFDNMPLDDDFLVRTPQAVFHDRVMDYCDKYMQGAPPDIIIPYLDAMLDRAKASKENFRYLLHTITEHYLQSNIMVYDAIYVHLVLKYYAEGDAWWMTPSDVETEVDRAARWDKLLVGRDAPELVLYDTLQQGHSLHAMPNQFTLLIFWSPSCGHCQTEIPALYEKFKAMRQQYDIGGFAILTEFDDETTVKWKRFIKEHGLDWINMSGAVANVDWHDVYDVTSTPQIYLLDKDKTILAKKLNANSFEQIMQAIIKERENGGN